MKALKKPSTNGQELKKVTSNQNKKSTSIEPLPLAVTNKSQELFDTNFWVTTALVKKIEDLELNALADARANEKMIKVNLSDL